MFGTRAWTLATALVCFLPATSYAEKGVTDTEVVLGMSSPLTGSSQALGVGMRDGIESYFAQVNGAGGVNGRKLRLEALDDGYEPTKTGPNMRKLINDVGVLAVIGNVGTPTAVVSLPIASQSKTLFFGAFTGAGILRKTPPDRYVINYRASYAEETAEMVRGFLSAGVKPAEIAFFSQNDAYGDSGFEGAVAALEAAGYKNAKRQPHGRYERNTEAVEEALTTILDAKVKPKAIIMVGTYKASAKFIKLAKSAGLKATFANVSFVGSDALKNELGKDGEGVIITQVVPPLDSDAPIVKEYRKALGAKTPSFVSLEGYVAARLFVEGLRKAGKDVNKEGLIDAFESLKELDVGLGVKLQLDKQRHQASSKVWVTTIRDNAFRTLSWSTLKK